MSSTESQTVRVWTGEETIDFRGEDLMWDSFAHLTISDGETDLAEFAAGSWRHVRFLDDTDKA